jgi:hypothetical protein
MHPSRSAARNYLLAARKIMFLNQHTALAVRLLNDRKALGSE